MDFLHNAIYNNNIQTQRNSVGMESEVINVNTDTKTKNCICFI